MNITLNARAKILRLTDATKAFRFQSTGTISDGSHLDLIPNVEAGTLDVTICDVPFIIADFGTVNFLTSQLVDFNYRTDEFVITAQGIT